MMATLSGEQERPLFVVSDSVLLEDLLRLANAAGVTATVAVDVTAARRWWISASLIVIDEANAAEAARLDISWRPGVVVAGRSPTPAQREPTRSAWQLASELGADHVAMLPEAEAWLVDRLSRPGPKASHARVVTVVGGRGGAGASILATTLAVSASQLGHRSLLIDADPLGAGLDVTLGQEELEGTRWSQLARAGGIPTTTSLLDALPRVGELCVLAWDRNEITAIPLAAMNSALDIANGFCDIIVIDVPRYPDEASVAALGRSDLTLLVVPAEVRAVFSAARVAAIAGEHCKRFECVVRGPAPAGLRANEIAEALRLPLAGMVKPESRLTRALEHGAMPELLRAGPLAQFCRGIVDRLDIGARGDDSEVPS